MAQDPAPLHNPPPATARLLLRPWRETDKHAFRAMNADPRVMEFFPSPLGAADSDALLERCNRMISERGFGFWALERRDDAAFIGFVGLSIPGWNPPFMPCVEIGWRLAHAFWGQGYASEAAHAALGFGFDTLGLEEIVAFTAADNLRSRRVMWRLGMRHSAQDDFTHPLIPPDSPLARHVLYRLPHNEWAHSI